MLRLADPEGVHLAASDKPDGRQTMDEDPSGPRCPCGSGMDDSRLCVCRARSLCRYRLAPRSALFSLALGGLGYRHTSHSLGDRQIPFPVSTCPTSSGAFPAEPAGDGLCTFICLGAVRAALGIAEWNGLPSIRFLVDALRGQIFLWNWLNLLADPGSLQA